MSKITEEEMASYQAELKELYAQLEQVNKEFNDSFTQALKAVAQLERHINEEINK